MPSTEPCSVGYMSDAKGAFPGKARRARAATVLLVVALLTLGAGVADAGNGTFPDSSSSSVAAGTSPSILAIGDFNSDGNEDLAIVNSSNVVIRLGVGNGTFSTGPPVSAGTAPGWVAVGDFNADGSEDLVITNSGSANATIRLGAGDGTFPDTAASTVNAGGAPSAIAVGDFNGDHKEDLAIGNSGSEDLTILLGTGSGTFTAASGSPIANGTQPYEVAVGDFNGDGKEDLAIANRNDTVSIRLGAGNGTFPALSSSTIPGGSGPSGVVVGDFNQDNRDDLAIADNSSSEVTVQLGAGDGTFAPAPGSPVGTGARPNGITLGDFNSDGSQDLATANFGGGTITVRLGARDGTFPDGSSSTVGAGNAPLRLAVGDFNSDGNQDLVATNYLSSNATIRLGAGPPADSGNLLVNGGAEAFRGASAPHDYHVIAAPPGWTTTNGFTYLRYGLNVFPSRLLSNRFDGQKAFFASGLSNTTAPSTAAQTVSVAGQAAAIDSGRASVRLSGYLGGYRTANESMQAAATFLNATGQPLGTQLQIGPVGLAERGQKTTFLPRSAAADVPAGTRSITVTLTATHLSGVFTDAAYADRMGLFLSTRPPAATPPDTTAPQTKITRRPRNRTRTRRVTYRFRSSEGHSRFQCRIDRWKRFRRCSSPFRLKHLRRGRHRFAVRAIDAAGNFDRTPARDTFRRGR